MIKDERKADSDEPERGDTAAEASCGVVRVHEGEDGATVVENPQTLAPTPRRRQVPTLARTVCHQPGRCSRSNEGFGDQSPKGTDEKRGASGYVNGDWVTVLMKDVCKSQLQVVNTYQDAVVTPDDTLVVQLLNENRAGHGVNAAPGSDRPGRGPGRHSRWCRSTRAETSS